MEIVLVLTLALRPGVSKWAEGPSRRQRVCLSCRCENCPQAAIRGLTARVRKVRISDIRPGFFCTMPRPTALGKLHRSGDACSTGGSGPDTSIHIRPARPSPVSASCRLAAARGHPRPRSRPPEPHHSGFCSTGNRGRRTIAVAIWLKSDTSE